MVTWTGALGLALGETRISRAAGNHGIRSAPSNSSVSVEEGRCRFKHTGEPGVVTPSRAGQTAVVEPAPFEGAGPRK
jgi:hypothetical protein